MLIVCLELNMNPAALVAFCTVNVCDQRSGSATEAYSVTPSL